MTDRRSTVTCHLCGLSAARRSDGGMPQGWAPAVIGTGRSTQRVVAICCRCPLPAGTLNRHPETRHVHP